MWTLDARCGYSLTCRDDGIQFVVLLLPFHSYAFLFTLKRGGGYEVEGGVLGYSNAKMRNSFHMVNYTVHFRRTYCLYNFGGITTLDLG